MNRLVLVLALAALAAACTRQTEQPAEQAQPQQTQLTPQPHANLAQVMRAIPFPASNIIFDTQSEDPEEKLKRLKAEAEKKGGATAQYATVYGGWQEVENAAKAIAETANLLMIPGRKCENGRDVPLDREDFRKFTLNLAQAGEAAFKAAQSRNLDQMVDVAGTLSEACAMCHEIYRDKDNPMDRCMP